MDILNQTESHKYLAVKMLCLSLRVCPQGCARPTGSGVKRQSLSTLRPAQDRQNNFLKKGKVMKIEWLKVLQLTT